MLRFLAGLIVTIFLITFIRAIAGLIGRAVGHLFHGEGQSSQQARKATKSGARAELKPCPSCGIYVSTETRLQKTVAGKTEYFCSEDCLKKRRA